MGHSVPGNDGDVRVRNREKVTAEPRQRNTGFKPQTELFSFISRSGFSFWVL